MSRLVFLHSRFMRNLKLIYNSKLLRIWEIYDLLLLSLCSYYLNFLPCRQTDLWVCIDHQQILDRWDVIYERTTVWSFCICLGVLLKDQHLEKEQYIWIPLGINHKMDYFYDFTDSAFIVSKKQRLPYVTWKGGDCYAFVRVGTEPGLKFFRYLLSC